MQFLSYLHVGIVGCAGLIAVAAAVSDVRRYVIPNNFCLAILFLFPLFVVTSPHDMDWVQNVATFGVVLAVGLLLFSGHLAGAGDIKFLSALALWAGPTGIGALLVVTGLAGGVLALGFAAWALRQRARAIVASTGKAVDVPVLAHIPIPYGVAIASGGVVMLTMLVRPILF